MKSQTIFIKNPVYILDTAAIVGPKEKDGPIGKYFEKYVDDDLLKQKSHEMAEIKMHSYTLKYLLNKTKLKSQDIDICFCGDLLDEIISSNFTMRGFDIPFMGLYNACATFGEGMILGAVFIDSGHAKKVICSTSSHFSSAERQYRYPLELGNQRTPLAQWTVTGAGAALLGSDKGQLKIDCATIGRVIDYGVKDANNLGAAMAPAARETLLSHFAATGRSTDYYDMIFTGDLGEAGGFMLQRLMKESGYELPDNHIDCGMLIYNREAQDVGQGGCGAGCVSTVFCNYIYPKMINGELKRILLVPTGALVSKTSSLQGETVPGIAHAISIERMDW